MATFGDDGEEDLTHGLPELDGEKHHARKSDDVSEIVSVAEFKRQWEMVHPLLINDSLRGAGPEDICAQMGLTPAELQKLRESCDTTSLLPPKGIEPILKLKIADLPITDSPLQTIRNPTLLKDILERKGMFSNSHMAITRPSSDKTPIQLPEVVISVLVFHPFKKRKDQEFLVLGSLSLCALRDKILCCNDYYIDKDYSENPDDFDRKAMEEGPPTRSHSAFFFINNTFYNDMRHPLSTDCSRVIIDWAESESRAELSPRLDHFQSANMADAKFEHLSFRIGYPYLYCHHRNCEHIVIFKDIRMLHPTDCQHVGDYPQLVYKHRERMRRCDVCEIFGPSWVTRNDDLATRSPCYFCEDCFRKLHYSHDGTKVCDFEAYPYHAGFSF